MIFSFHLKIYDLKILELWNSFVQCTKDSLASFPSLYHCTTFFIPPLSPLLKGEL